MAGHLGKSPRPTVSARGGALGRNGNRQAVAARFAALQQIAA